MASKESVLVGHVIVTSLCRRPGSPTHVSNIKRGSHNTQHCLEINNGSTLPYDIQATTSLPDSPPVNPNGSRTVELAHGSLPVAAAWTANVVQLAGGDTRQSYPRGTSLSPGLAMSINGTPAPFPIATDQVALELGRPDLAMGNLHNAVSDGRGAWKSLGYRGLSDAYSAGVKLQGTFADINTDSADLTAFRSRGGKLIQWHGMADQLIPSQGSFNYASRLFATMGGAAKVDNFYRFYPVPAAGHCGGVGSTPGLAQDSPAPNPPLPSGNQFFSALVDWVEKGNAPADIVLSSRDGKAQRPICAYPRKLTYRGGDSALPTSYLCK